MRVRHAFTADALLSSQNQRRAWLDQPVVHFSDLVSAVRDNNNDDNNDNDNGYVSADHGDDSNTSAEYSIDVDHDYDDNRAADDCDGGDTGAKHSFDVDNDAVTDYAMLGKHMQRRVLSNYESLLRWHNLL